MPVVGERFRDAQPAHHDESYVIDNAGLGRFATIICIPRGFDLRRCWFNQRPFLTEILPKNVDSLPKGAPSRDVAAFPKNERHRNESTFPLDQQLVSRVGSDVPLIPGVPSGDQPDCIQKDVAHG